VEVALDDEPLGRILVTGGFAPYTVAIPEALAARLSATGAPVRLRLTTPVWKPEEVLGTSDARELGVMVDRVTVK
jgi:hypothetical protein